MDLYEIMRQAGGGNAFAALAPHFGLSEPQVVKALEALLPAFSAGLKRSTANPLGLFEFMRQLGAANYLRAYQNPGSAWGEGGREAQDALSFLFGSGEVAREVSERASALSGLSQQKLAELMPAMAAIMFGGLTSHAAAANPWLDAMLKQFRPPEEKKAVCKGPLDRYEEEQAKREPSAAANFAQAPTEMMQAGMTAFQTGMAAWQRAVSDAMQSAGVKKPEAATSGEKLFGEMFEPGLRFSEAYRRELEALLERSASASKQS